MKRKVDWFRVAIILAGGALTVYLAFALSNPFVGGVP